MGEGDEAGTRWRPLIGAAGAAWLAAVSAGFLLLERYKATPGAAGEPPGAWRGVGRIVPEPGRATLILVAHPRCPCTRASLAELERILVRCRGSVAAHVLFPRPPGAAASWERSGLWRAAEAIPGVRVHADEGGVEAARLGAATSGHVLLFDASGRLLYTGGITGSRGHEGDNPGRAAVLRLLGGERSNPGRGPVFGCPLIKHPPDHPRGPRHAA